MLLGALGSCMTMTLLLHSCRKEWPLEKVEVSIEHDRVHAEDAESVKALGGLMEHFKIDLVLNSDLYDWQLDCLAEIWSRCPIRKTLAGAHVFDETVRAA